MELAQLNQRIAVANAESKRLNQERAVNMGKRQTLEKQLNDAIALYNQTYGTSISVNDLNNEIQRVAVEKEQEVSNIETVLGLIKEGKFDEAQTKVSGVVEQPQVAPTPSVEPVAEPTPAPTPVMPTFTKPVVEEPVITPQVAMPTPESVVAPHIPTPTPEPVPTPPTMPTFTKPVVEEPVATPPTAPKLSGLDTSVQEPVKPKSTMHIPTPPTMPAGLSGLDVEEDDGIGIGLPPTLGMPPKIDKANNLGGDTSNAQPVKSFNAMIGGSMFKPQGNI
jgi:hypothetical protein